MSRGRRVEWIARDGSLRAAAYSDYLNTEEWKSTRDKKLQSVKCRCEMCGSTGPLQVHHLNYCRLGQEKLNDLRVLCSKCHALSHTPRFEAFLDGVAGGGRKNLVKWALVWVVIVLIVVSLGVGLWAYTGRLGGRLASLEKQPTIEEWEDWDEELLPEVLAPTKTPTLRPETVSEYIPSNEASDHVGENAVVCGPVVDTHYAVETTGSPTFLNFDRPHPDQTFTILIWGDDRHKFPSDPEDYFKGKSVCVTGTIETYKERVEIIARNPEQLWLK